MDTQDQSNNTQDRLPRDCRAAVKDVIETIKALNSVYEEETRALESADTKTFMSLQEKKILVAQSYQNKMTQILARKSEVNMIDQPLKDRLKDLQVRFSDISQKNLAAIERMQRCTEQLGNRIRAAAIQSAQNQRSFSYSETGAIPNTTQKKVVSSGLSETV